VWGTTGDEQDNVVWGTAADEADNIVWGTATEQPPLFDDPEAEPVVFEEIPWENLFEPVPVVIPGAGGGI
jgi:hypothetical protein